MTSIISSFPLSRICTRMHLIYAILESSQTFSLHSALSNTTYMKSGNIFHRLSGVKLRKYLHEKSIGLAYLFVYSNDHVISS
jgi:hypothetical protein